MKYVSTKIKFLLLLQYCLMKVNICVKLYWIPVINEGVMDQASCFITFVIELCLATQFLVNAQYLMSWWTFVSSYIKFLQLMKRLQTRQAVFSHLTLNYDLDLGPSHTVFGQWTSSHDGEQLYKVILNFCN